ncbi:uncharacterized protein LOC111597566 [Drosophila hydei]|uniref:Uncharacterized protein LOC111597566 n=1 Tax=Drosophila hydei TaxID=7224 RepID=A0A6J1LL91_DROHY|nr:uncharacterized protein LOC111597566 [Drosophila hydei]
MLWQPEHSLKLKLRYSYAAQGNAGIGIPVYFDNFNPNPPVEPLKPVQPVAVVAPVSLQTPGFPQNLPIVGTLLTNLPLQNLLTGLNLGQLGQLGQLGSLGNFGNFGQLGNLPGFGPPAKPPGGDLGSPAQTCPLSQKLSCRCEPLISLPLRQPDAQSLVQILKQNVRHNENGSQELHLVLSNGHVIYHRNDQVASSQLGYYALPFQTGHYLNIRYSINQANYTIKAEVDSSAPSTDFEL